jgi:hypothetical protein
MHNKIISSDIYYFSINVFLCQGLQVVKKKKFSFRGKSEKVGRYRYLLLNMFILDILGYKVMK